MQHIFMLFYNINTINYIYLDFGGLFPRPFPDTFPVVLGPLGGRGAVCWFELD